MDRYKHCQQLLADLEQSLKVVGLWSVDTPSSKAFKSSMPFCVDTMALEQWLQFIFIPRMTDIVHRQLPLPKAAGLQEYASECYKDHLLRLAPVVDCLAAFDAFFAERSIH